MGHGAWRLPVRGTVNRLNKAAWPRETHTQRKRYSGHVAARKRRLHIINGFAHDITRTHICARTSMQPHSTSPSRGRTHHERSHQRVRDRSAPSRTGLTNRDKDADHGALRHGFRGGAAPPLTRTYTPLGRTCACAKLAQPLRWRACVLRLGVSHIARRGTTHPSGQ